ncbi:MAG: RagB/SusD family nutrient uptake outer membrane protein [Prevotella sp.]|nr:RagB/SusD family nutrient uptake outer membrane protein [Prevotella sp.]
MSHIKTIHHFALCIVTFSLVLTACGDFVDVDSNSVIKTDDYNINDEPKARYTMFGILAQLQRVADRYVILGELRGDLLTTTENSTQDLHDIAEFNVDSLNAYHIESDLYAIINSCNYMLSRIDTSVVITNNNGEREKVLKYEMAQAKAIRAWCYLQLLINYGTASYYTDPIVDVDQEIQSQEMNLDALAPVLIEDLRPWVPEDDEEMEQMPDYGTVGNYASKQLFIPIRAILGDLYLYTNNYEAAARMYYAHLLSNSLTVVARRNSWTDNTFTRETGNWTSLFSLASEMQSLIQCTTSYIESVSQLSKIFDEKEEYLLAPSAAGLHIWESQTYAYGSTVSTLGDLRGPYGTYSLNTVLRGEAETEVASVSKYKNLSQTVIMYRTSTIYLRYAEAINRLGKHRMAFALLKYGLNREKLLVPSYVPPTEFTDDEGKVIPYLDFGQGNLNYDTKFSSNVGMHSRGCGERIADFRSYDIETGVDALTFVEDQLLTEMALETGYEGNRFADIMRIGRHRHSTSFVATTIAKRAPALNAYLQDESHWYLPHSGSKPANK